MVYDLIFKKKNDFIKILQPVISISDNLNYHNYAVLYEGIRTIPVLKSLILQY